MKIFVFIFCFLFLHSLFGANVKQGSYGIVEEGYPKMGERAAICGINQCRFDKDYFASSVLDTPTILQASFYENTTPVYWNLKLNKIARAHTQVMAEDDCFTTSECSDGSSSTRYNNENYVYESLGENIDCMHPYTSSYSYVRNLVCEDVEYNSCIADSVLTDIEDRNNTMDSAFQEVGIGLAGDSKSTCKNYYTESYGERSDFSYPSHPVVSGAHFDDQNNFFFILTYFEHLSPTAIPQWVYVVHKPQASSTWEVYEMFETSAHTYTKTITAPSSCDSYFFMVKDSSDDIWRYPEGEDLVTADGYDDANICGTENSRVNDCDPELDCNDGGACRGVDRCACMNGETGYTCGPCEDAAPAYVDGHLENKFVNVNAEIDYIFSAEAFSGDNLEYEGKLSNGDPLPGTVTFTPSTRAFAGIFPDGCTETYTIAITATNCAGTATGSFDVTVTNDPPNLGQGLSDERKPVNIQFTVDVSQAFTDPEGEELQYTSSQTNGDDLPTWLNLDGALGEFTGKAPETICDETTFDLWLNVTDSCSTNKNTDQFSLTMYNDPITYNSDSPLEDQIAYSQKQFTYNFPQDTFLDPENVKLTYSAKQSNGSDLPSWLTIEETKSKFTGTPPFTCDEIVYEIVTTANDGCYTADGTFTITIVNHEPRVDLPLDNKAFAQDEAFDFSLPGDSFVDPEKQDMTYEAVLSNGDPLPDWMTFTAANQNFVGTTPTEYGVWEVEVTATDDCSQSTSDTFEFGIPSSAPTLNDPIPDQDALANDKDYSFVFSDTTFEGVAISYTAALSNGSNLPDWLSFYSGWRQFEGQVPSGCEDSWEIEIVASNNLGDDSETFVLTKDNYEPEYNEPDFYQLETNEEFSFTLPEDTFTDIEGVKLSIEVTLEDGQPLPNWLDWNEKSWTFSGTTDDVSDIYVIEFIVDDDCPENQIAVTYEIEVLAPTPTPTPTPTDDDDDDDDDQVNGSNRLLSNACLFLFLSLFILFK